MDLEGILCSHNPTIGLYTVTDKFIPYTPILFFYRSILILYSHLCIYKYHKFGYLLFVPFSHFLELCFSEETDLFGIIMSLLKQRHFV